MFHGSEAADGGEPDMTEVTFVEPDGNWNVVDAVVGDTLMTAAISNLVKGVIGDCGGGLSCATCHVFVDDAWADAVGGPGDDESGMLEMTAVAATDRSRLSCQIVFSEALSGLVVHVPERQD
jgi:2Fe-2S ferredoxin